MKCFFIAAGAVACTLCIGFSETHSEREERSVAYSSMTSTINELLRTFNDEQREKVLFSFEDAERFDWHFVPRARNGLPLKEMSEPQREATMNLLRAALSDDGVAKVENILVLEGVLDEIESATRPGRAGFRDPEMYFLTLFGEPSEDKPWGWRFEGHHLSLNFSTVSGLVAGTPAFYGANPAKVPEGLGQHSGLRVLGHEEDSGREFVSRLDEDQRARAIITATAPRDIITGNEREVSLTSPSGLPFTELNEEQQEMLRRLIGVYIDKLDTDVAADYWRRIADRGWDQVHFAWAGGTEEGQGHYYRIHGPTFLIEYDNVQNNANHVHSVLRDLENDWGEDFLRRHYEQHEHP